MPSNWPRRAALAFACLGATAAVGTASAAATTFPGENIYGMGSSLQQEAQTAGLGTSGGACGATGWIGWVATWHCNPATDQKTLNNDPSAFYTTESSGVGLAEFGNAASSGCTSTTGVLSPACDPTANANSELDAFIGTDDPPNQTDLTNASTAAGAGVQEVTVPVAQAPVAMILSLPVGFTVGTGGKVKYTSQTIANLWSTTGVASWCDLLNASGLTRITSGTPNSTQYLDTTSNCGGSITLYARSKGSGTTFSFRGYLYELDKYGQTTSYPYSLVTDGPSDWPVTVTETGPNGANGSGQVLVANTTATPGSVGYANLADAALASPAYKNVVSTTSTGGSHQIVYAFVQNNTPDTTAFYASPSNTAGTVNEYTGSHIGINVSTCAAPNTARVVGCWVVPSTPTGAWSSSTESPRPGTIPSDADVYDHGTVTGPSHNYPIVAATYDVAWTDYDNTASNLDLNNYYNDPSCPSGTNCPHDAGNSTHSYLSYLASTGQSNLASAKVYFGALPAAIKTKAVAAANAITP